MNLFKHLLGAAQFHGSHRLTGRKYRLIWVVTLLLCLWGAISIIMANIWQYLQMPAYQVTKESPETTVKFPSVVVCPEIRYPRFKIDAFLSGLKYPPGLNETYIKSVIRQLAAFYAPDISYSIVNVQNIEKFLDYNNISIESASLQLTLTCEETILRCRYLGEMIDCSRLFEREVTNFGFCCIFNGRSLRREVKDYGIQNVVPPPVLSSDRVGHTSGLMFVVNSSQTMDNIDLDYKWMYLAKGQQFIESNKNGTPISRSEEYWFAFYSVGHVLDRDASELSHELRQCRKVSEKLQYFPSYLRLVSAVCELSHELRQCRKVSEKLQYFPSYLRLVSAVCELSHELRQCRKVSEKLQYFPSYLRKVSEKLQYFPSYLRLVSAVSELSHELRQCRKVSKKLQYFPSYLRLVSAVSELSHELRQCRKISEKLQYFPSYLRLVSAVSELSHELRQCRKVSEKLQYFPSYLRQYCLIECEMRRTMERCRCVSFTHPKPPHWNYCRASNLACIKYSAVTNRDTQCNCEKTCDTTSDMDVIMNFPLRPGQHVMDPFYDGLNYSKVTIVRAFLLNYNFKTNEIRTYYTEIALFSQIGGALNIFFGCSILTVIEMVQLVWYGARQYWIFKCAQKAKQQLKHQPAKKKNTINNKNKKKNVKFQKTKK
ncbi:hypothetical protein O0L34_g18428 [Tuta absoluta]|nr:hypothetical protein O0L34_g18428 [Tuta absoluta]